MNPVFLALFFVVLGVIGYKLWYDSTDHWHKDNGIAALREDAKPIRTEEKTVGLRHSNRVRTTVYFDDGFRYVSHKCAVKDFAVFYKVSMTDDIRKEIQTDAIEAHATEIAIREGKIR